MVVRIVLVNSLEVLLIPKGMSNREDSGGVLVGIERKYC